MIGAPLDLYDQAIAAHSGPDGCRCLDWNLRYADGRALPLALARWCNKPDRADRELLGRCTDPTLDVGCGPGRLVSALAASGGRALGIDIAESAVRLTRLAGATAVRTSIFSPLPDEGHWRTVLLVDGNIGIGGDPIALLRRCRDVIAIDGQILLELDAPGTDSNTIKVRLEARQHQSTWFSWAHLGIDALAETAAAAGLVVRESWATDGRWFACVAR